MNMSIPLQSPWIALRLLLAMLAAAIAGCAGSPEAPDRPVAVRASDETARKAVDYARDMVGKPYKYAGDSPAGFDCSGLVRYSYGKAGIKMPRDTGSHRVVLEGSTDGCRGFAGYAAA